ncbi:macro domain-containing protein [Streptosporangium nondiastaticum]|uniref:macro domain-containing protein n=1 Tax=Streptosporangium nondiastaticum TaxID=35764 RepID=UPI00336A02B9
MATATRTCGRPISTLLRGPSGGPGGVFVHQQQVGAAVGARFQESAGSAIAASGPPHRGPGVSGCRRRRAVAGLPLRESQRVAEELGARTVAFPAMSTGVCRRPAEGAARIAVEAVRQASALAEEYRFVLFHERAYGHFRRAGEAIDLLIDRERLPGSSLFRAAGMSPCHQAAASRRCAFTVLNALEPATIRTRLPVSSEPPKAQPRRFCRSHHP